MKRLKLEPKTYHKLQNWHWLISFASFCAALIVAFASMALLLPCQSTILKIILPVIGTVATLALYVLSMLFFSKAIKVARPWGRMDGKGMGAAGNIISTAAAAGSEVWFYPRRVAGFDMSYVDKADEIGFIRYGIAQGACCLLFDGSCDDAAATAALLKAGARHLEDDIFVLDAAVDVEYLYKELLYLGRWTLLCGAQVWPPRLLQVRGYQEHPDKIDAVRIINHASLVINSWWEDDEDWMLCWDDGGMLGQRCRAFVLTNSLRERGALHHFLTRTVGTENVAAVHETDRRSKGWSVYGVASRDWAQLARRAEKSGEVFFSLRAPAEQVLQAWRGGGCYVDVENAEEAHALSGDGGFSTMLYAIMPEGGCVLSCSHDAEYVYVWAHDV